MDRWRAHCNRLTLTVSLATGPQVAAAASQANYGRDGLPVPVPHSSIVFTGISPGSVLIALRVSFPLGSHATPFVKWLSGGLERAGIATAGEPKWVPVPPGSMFSVLDTATNFTAMGYARPRTHGFSVRTTTRLGQAASSRQAPWSDARPRV
jgi:hypothetical protein